MTLPGWSPVQPDILKIGIFSSPALMSSERGSEILCSPGRLQEILISIPATTETRASSSITWWMSSLPASLSEGLEMNLTLSVRGQCGGVKSIVAGWVALQGGRRGVNPTLGCNGISQYHKVTIANPRQFRYILLLLRQNMIWTEKKGGGGLNVSIM